MPPRDDDAPPTRTKMSDFDQEVIDVIAELRGIEATDIKLDASFVDWGNDVDELVVNVARHFEVRPEALRGVKTVEELIEKLEDARDFD